MKDSELKIVSIPSEFDIENVNSNKPKDFRGLIAISDSGDPYVIATTDDCELVDLFINGRGPDDNGIEIRESLNVGLYHVQFLPWSFPTYEGDYDCGIDIKVLECLSNVHEEFLMESYDSEGSKIGLEEDYNDE